MEVIRERNMRSTAGEIFPNRNHEEWSSHLKRYEVEKKNIMFHTKTRNNEPWDEQTGYRDWKKMLDSY